MRVRDEMNGGQMVAILIVVVLVMGALFGVVLYWLVDLCSEQEVRTSRAWERAVFAQNEAWTRMTQERKVWSEQLTTAHQSLVEVVKNTQPRDRTEDVARLDALKREVSMMLNRVQLMLGVSNHPVDHDAETQKTPQVISGEGLPS